MSRVYDVFAVLSTLALMFVVGYIGHQTGTLIAPAPVYGITFAAFMFCAGMFREALTEPRFPK